VRSGLAVVVAGALLLGSAPARAEMFRCAGPDGRTLFTSDRSKCPNAAPHETTGRIQKATGATEPRARKRQPTTFGPARRAAMEEAAEAQVWRAKRTNAEADLVHTRGKIDQLHEVAGWCNRGHEVWATDRDGLRHDVDCNDVKREERNLLRAKADLEHYLAEGLEEECRRAGCLPGWLRD